MSMVKNIFLTPESAALKGRTTPTQAPEGSIHAESVPFDRVLETLMSQARSCGGTDERLNDAIIERLQQIIMKRMMDVFLADEFPRGISCPTFLSLPGEWAIRQDRGGAPPPVSSREVRESHGSQTLDASTTSRSGRADVDAIILKASNTHGVDPDLIRCVIRAESNFRSSATSPKGAMGLMQLMPATARDLGVQRPYDPEENVMGGTKYLKQLLKRYNGSITLTLAAYNWGMGNVEKNPERLPLETRNYVSKIVSDLHRAKA